MRRVIFDLLVHFRRLSEFFDVRIDVRQIRLSLSTSLPGLPRKRTCQAPLMSTRPSTRPIARRPLGFRQGSPRRQGFSKILISCKVAARSSVVGCCTDARFLMKESDETEVLVSLRDALLQISF